MTIKYPVCEPDIGIEEENYVLDCVRSSWISSLGKYIDDFESGLSKRFARKHSICTSNGTTALHLALLAAGIESGDEVIVPALTFVACANTVLYQHAKPVFVDIERSSWNIDPARIEQSITPRTKAIIVVHSYGHPADMDPILEIAQRHSLIVIEDCAEAHGAIYKDRIVGTMGDYATYSFYGNKIMTTGEGGAVLLNDDQKAQTIRQLRDHNMDPNRRYFHPGLGYNYRMTNVQASIGLAQLEKLNHFLEKKRQIARWYDDKLAASPFLECSPNLAWAAPVYWLYTLLLNKEKQIDRGKLAQGLRERGIDSRPLFIPLNQLPYTGSLQDSCIVADELSQLGFNLPSSTKLEKKDVDWIADQLLEILTDLSS